MAASIYRGVGKRIREIRSEQGLSQAAVAEGADLAVQYYASIERGTRPGVPLHTIEAIAKALGTTTGDLVGGKPVKKPRAPLPAAVDRVAREVAALPPARRKTVLTAIRALLRLA